MERPFLTSKMESRLLLCSICTKIFGNFEMARYTQVNKFRPHFVFIESTEYDQDSNLHNTSCKKKNMKIRLSTR